MEKGQLYPAEAQGFEGTWQGTLHVGRQLRIATKITKADGGGYKAVYYSIDEGGLPLSIDKVDVDGSSLTLTLNLMGVKYEGKLSGDGKTIAGTWTQGPKYALAAAHPCHPRNGMEYSDTSAAGSADGRRCEPKFRGCDDQAEQ